MGFFQGFTPSILLSATGVVMSDLGLRQRHVMRCMYVLLSPLLVVVDEVGYWAFCARPSWTACH